MPSRHSSIVGGSSAARLVNCPGSTRLLAQLPAVTDRDSSYSIEGTALHEVIERLIVGEITIAELYASPLTVALKGQTVLITPDLIRDALEPALAFWDDLATKVDSWQLETEVHFPGLPGVFGTADILARDDVENITYVTDWKFGAGVGVEAVYTDPDDPMWEVVNEQLLFYAAAARHTQPKFFPPGCRIVLTIVQPRARDVSPITSVEVSLADLDAFVAELQAAVARSQEDNAPTRRGRWCRFVACKTICPHHTGPLFDLEAIAPSAVTDPADPTYRAMLIDILDAAPAVEMLIKEARAQAHLILADGGTLPGWKLVAKRGTRQWTVDAVELAKRLRRALRLKKAQLYDRVLKSPAAVERLLPKKVKLPDDLVVMVSSGTTLAPADDKREAIEAEPGTMSKILIEALAASAEDD
jgi:hypothetical protein